MLQVREGHPGNWVALSHSVPSGFTVCDGRGHCGHKEDSPVDQ